MTSPLPPRRRDTLTEADLIRQDRSNLQQRGVGFVDGRFPPARPRSGGGGGEDDDGDEESDFSDQPMFRNTDTVSAGAGNVPFLLTELPEDGSVVVHWHPNGGGGIHLPRTAWTRIGQLLTITAFTGQGSGDYFTAEYAYYPGSQDGVAITSPDDGATVSDTTPTITGTGDVGFTVTVKVDGVLVGTAVVADNTTWTVTVGSPLSPGNHTITAEETLGDFDDTATSTFTTPSPTAATATIRGNSSKGGNNSGFGMTSLALPSGTQVGDLIVVSGHGNTASALTVTDARLTAVGDHMWIGFATTLGDLQMTAHGGYGKLWGVACITLITNAVGWTSAVNTFDTDISSGETLPISSVGGVAAAVCGIRDSRSVVSGSTSTPVGYTTGGGSPVGQIHTRVDFWTNGTITASPSTTSTMLTGTHGTAYADVIGLIGP